MHTTRTWLFTTCLLGVGLLGPSGSRAEEMQDTEVLAPIYYTVTGEAGTVGVLLFGTNQGVVPGERLALYRPSESEGLVGIGHARIDSLTTEWALAWLRVEGVDSAEVGDLVELRLRVPTSRAAHLTWDLGRKGITYTTADDDTIFSSASAINFPDQWDDQALLEACATQIAEVTSRLEDNETALAVIESGRYQGKRILDAMREATPAQVRAYFQYVLSYPGRYSGQTYRIEESFAGWASSGGPLSALEAIERAAALDDEAVKQFLAPFHDLFLQEKPVENWYELSRDAWLAGQHEEARSILRIMRLSSEVMDLPYWWFYTWTATADIEDWAGNSEAALAANAEAMIAAGDDPSNVGHLHHNRATILESVEDWEGGIVEFETALRTWGALPDTFSTTTGGNTWRGLGRCYHKLQRYEEAALAFRTAAQLLEAEGDLTSLERLATTYSHLGDVYESMGRYGQAIEIWRQGRDAAERLGWKGTMASALVDVSDGQWNLGEYRDAVATRQEAMALYEELGDERNQAIALTNLGELQWILGEVDTARVSFARAREVHVRRGEHWDAADVSFREGSKDRARGDHPAALERLREAEQLFAAAEDSTALANTRLELAEANEGLSRKAEADSLYVLARDGYHRARDRAQEARVLDWWGWTLLSRRQYRDARQRLEESLAIREAIGDLAGLTDGLRRVSDILAYQEGEKERALAAAERSLAIALEMPSTPKIAEARLTLGNRLWEAGRLLDGMDQGRQALAAFEEIEDGGGVARAHNYLGSLLDARGDGAGAMEEYTRAAALADSADQPGLRANVLGAMAWHLYLEASYAPAESLARAGLAIQKELGNESATPYFLNTLSSCADDQGRFDEALTLAEEARVIREAYSDLFGLSASYHNIGHTMIRMRDYEAAIPYLERSLALGEQIGYYEATLASVASLGNCYLELGRGEEALPLARRALDIARSTGARPREADVLILIGKMERKLARFNDARRDLGRGLAIADSLGKTLTVLSARQELGAVALAEKQPAEAERILTEVVAALESFRNPTMLWEPLLFLGRAQRDGGKLDAAVESYRRSMGVVEDVRAGISDETQSQEYQTHHGEVYRELVSIYLSQGRREEAHQVLALMKAQELRDLATLPASEQGSGEARDAATKMEGLRSHEVVLARKLRDELSRPQTEQRAELITLWQAQIDSVNLALHDFVGRLRREQPELYARLERLEVSPDNFRKFQRGLKEGEAFLEPLILPDRVVLFVVRGGSDPLLYRETLVGETRVRELIREMRERLAQPAVAWESRTTSLAVDPAVLEIEDPTEPARGLDSLLIAPVRGDLDGIRTLIVSPSGPLRYIPFGALYDGEQYLLDRFEVIVLTQAGTLEERTPLGPDAPMVAFGNPDSSLSGAEQEVRALAEMWRPSPVADFYGATATKALLRQQLEGCRVLHLATHGVLLAENPEGSYLLLGGSEAASRLTLRDILLLPMQNLDLAVLSACQTAMGDKGEGSEVAGLAYTFEQTGAGSVVASLWNVNDNSTAELMTEFYRTLRAGDTTKAAAMRKAQLAVRQKAEFAHPYYWAPFILIGNWR